MKATAEFHFSVGYVEIFLLEQNDLGNASKIAPSCVYVYMLSIWIGNSQRFNSLTCEVTIYSFGKIFYAKPATPFALDSKHTLLCPVPLCDSDGKAQLCGLYW